MIIKIKSLSGDIPQYETEGSAGMDIKAYLKEPIKIAPGKRALIPTGLFLEIPTGYEVQIRARSGLAVKYGIPCLFRQFRQVSFLDLFDRYVYEHLCSIVVLETLDVPLLVTVVFRQWYSEEIII